MEDPMAEIRATFFQECEEQLAALEAGLTDMQSGTAEAETVNAVFRAVHSMKGGAGIFAIDALVRFAHVFETALDKVRSGELAATPPAVGLFLGSDSNSVQIGGRFMWVRPGVRGEDPALRGRTFAALPI